MKLDAKNWTVIAAITGAAATFAARQATKQVWRHVTDEDPPSLHHKPDTGKLLLYTAVAAAIAAVVSTSAKVGVHALRDDTSLTPGKD
jgi:hypothetical protein